MTDRTALLKQQQKEHRLSKPRTKNKARRAARAVGEVSRVATPHCTGCGHGVWPREASAVLRHLRSQMSNTRTYSAYPSYISAKPIANHIVALLAFVPVVAQARPTMQRILVVLLLSMRGARLSR